MFSLETGLKRLASKLTGKPYSEVPGSLEGIVEFTADNLELAGGAAGEKGETGAKGDTGPQGVPGADGVGVAANTLTIQDGAVTGGKWTGTDGAEHDINLT